MTVSLDVRAEAWPIHGRFVISRGAKTEAQVVVVRLDDGMGQGECVPYPRYGETIDSVMAQIAAAAPEVRTGADRERLAELMPPGAARNAIDCALWDLAAKRSGIRAWQAAGLARLDPVTTAFTLSLDSPQNMAAAARENADRPILKLKIGGADDLDRLAAVRAAAPAARLIVDANEALTIDDLERIVGEFSKLGVEMVEQPLPVDEDGALEGFVSPIPLCADESLHSRAELARCARRYSVVNIKLDKTGGLTEALALKSEARRLGLKILVGCMVSTSLSIAPAMLLAQDADWADLDGAILLDRDREPCLKARGSVIEPPSPALWG